MYPKDSQAQLSEYIEQQRWMLHIAQAGALIDGPDAIPHILSGVVGALKADCARLVVEEGDDWRIFSAGEWDGDCPGWNLAILEALEQQAGDDLVEFVRGQSAHPDAIADVVPEALASLVALWLPGPVGRRFGMLWAGFRETHPFSEAERSLIHMAAAQAAIALHHARSIAEAQKQQKWLAAILTSTPDPVLVVNHDLRLELANPAAQEAFETLKSADLGQPLAEVDGLAELIDLFDGDSGHDRAQGREVDKKRNEFAAENGKVYAPRVSDVRTEDGAMAGWVLVLRDISPFKRLNDNMSEFLSTVSHDMRSPLTFMKGYCDMLGMVGPLNEKQTGFAQKIAVGVVQMSDMVEKILDAAKIDPVTGNYTLSREACDMKELVEKIMAGLAEPASRQRLEMSLSIDPGAPVMNIDRAMISSAYTNLVENAIKYTPEGGKVEVELKIDRAQNSLCFRVADNGLGISEADQRKLFQRNVRVRRPEWKRIKGSGLGLFIVKNVAQRHGGDAWVDSVPGQGSTFYLSIPMDGSNMIGGEGRAHD